jgi:glutathione synthase
MSERLAEDGMFFVGLDIIGGKVVEINPESPGGFQSVEHFTGIDFAPAIIDALEQKLAGR